MFELLYSQNFAAYPKDDVDRIWRHGSRLQRWLLGSQPGDRIRRNKRRLVSLLRDQRVSAICLEYQGGGDSGDVVDISTSPFDRYDDVMCLRVPYLWIGHAYDEQAQGSGFVCGARELTVEDAMRHLWEMMICDGGHSGWENNDGGRGTLTLDVDAARLSLEHIDYYVDERESDHEY